MLEDRKASFQYHQNTFDKGSVEESYFKGAAMGIECSLSLYKFNHVDPGYLGDLESGEEG